MYLRLAYESLDLLNLEQKLIIQFPYQSIISWGSSSTIFQISVFPPQVSYARDRETIKISFLTHEGKLIDARIMRMIRMLMADMDSCAISKEEFATLKRQLVQDSQLMVGSVGIVL